MKRTTLETLKGWAGPILLLLAAFAFLAYNHPVHAADLDAPCCADVEKSIGELDAAVAKANSKPWSGPYAGVHVGYAWGNAEVRDNAKDGVPPGPFDYDVDGVFGGGTAGYNLQVDGIVLGVEGDLGYLDAGGKGIIGSAHADHHQDLTLDGGLYGDITGRVGLLLTPKTLVYGKGGFAFFNGGANQATTADGYSSQGTGTFTGWTAGGGIEQMLTEHVSLRLEYLHFDFGSEEGAQTSITDPPVGHVYKNSHDVDVDTVKAGIVYHFN